jgi:hypothetical protein
VPLDFFDPTTRRQNVLLVDAPTLQAEKLIETCEYCNEEEAEIPFDAILAGAIHQHNMAILLFLED